MKLTRLGESVGEPTSRFFAVRKRPRPGAKRGGTSGRREGATSNSKLFDWEGGRLFENEIDLSYALVLTKASGRLSRRERVRRAVEVAREVLSKF